VRLLQQRLLLEESQLRLLRPVLVSSNDIHYSMYLNLSAKIHCLSAME
jgi:hypothetical protein